MDEEMEDTVMLTFTAVEIDLDYEFDAAGFFDFTREESIDETREAELWFESLGSYPPSPFVKKLQLKEDILLQNVTTSPKTKASENMVLSETDSDIGANKEISAMDTNISDYEGLNGTDSTNLQSCTLPNFYKAESIPTDYEGLNGTDSTNLQSCTLPNFYKAESIPTGLTFYNHMIESNTIRKTTTKPFVPRISTLMKPTASQLAKQSRSRQVDNSRFVGYENKDRSFNNTIASENQAAKRQKLEGGQLRKVADTNQETQLVHKDRKRDGNIDVKSTHTKLHLTIPKEPDLKTAHRARRMRPEVGREREQVTSTTHIFRALPLNRKILEAPSLSLRQRSTPRLPEFQEFHLKTSERALQHNAALPLYSVHCNNPKVPHQPIAGLFSECSNNGLKRQVELKQGGSEILHNFKATPLNKKILSSKGEMGIFRNNKRETTVPKEFSFHTERRLQHDPPVDLFNKLTLTSELRSNAGSHSKVPQSTCTFAKGSKENRLGSFQQESKVKKLFQEEPQGLKFRQIPSFGGGTKMGDMSGIIRSSGIR